MLLENNVHAILLIFRMKIYIFIILLLAGCTRYEATDNYHGEWRYEYYTPEGDLWGIFSINLEQRGDQILGSHYISIMEGEINDISTDYSIHGEVQDDLVRITIASSLEDNPGEAEIQLLNKDSLLFVLTKPPYSSSDKALKQQIIPNTVLFVKANNNLEESIESLVNIGITWHTWKNKAKELIGVEPTEENFINLSGDDAKKIYTEYYWNEYKIDDIININSKYLIFDCIICSPSNALSLINKVLSERFDINITPSDSMSSEMIDAINGVDQEKFYNELIDERDAHYHNRAKLPEHYKFKPVWRERIESFRN